MRGCRVGWAVLGAVTVAALAPATAGAVGVNVTDDAGNPVQVAGQVIRNMNAAVSFPLAPFEGFVKVAVVGPDGQHAMSPVNCSSFVGNRTVDYRGNGPYTILVQSFLTNDFSCAAPIGGAITAYTVAASTPIAAPRGRVLFRANGTSFPRAIDLPIALNPGALTTEVRYARNARTGPDGGIAGASREAFADSSRGVVPLRLDRPGRWVVAARAKGFTGAGGQFFTPWSTAVVRAVAPFDLERLTFPDSRGPSYQIRGLVRERSARGAVRISIATGRRGGRFRSVGSARIRKGGVFVKRLRIARQGTYRLRFQYRGSATTNRGAVVEPIRITRRIFL